MSESAEAAAAQTIRGARAWWVLLALVAGLVAGMLAARMGDGFREPALKVASTVGGLWLDALKMTVIPLIVALLVTGIAKGAEAARAGRVAARSIAWFIALYVASAILGGLGMQALLGAFPLSEASASALRTGLAGLPAGSVPDTVPTLADFFTGIIPSNVVESAAKGDVLQLVVFALLFALAVSQIGPERRRPVIAFFDGVADALLVVIAWVLRIAPLGVFALAFAVGAGAGGRAFEALAHYIVLVSLLGVIVGLAGYLIAITAGRIGAGTFARGMIAPQSLAFSTESSLACLPAMLAAARNMGISQRVADVTLPMSVALLRATGPAMNIGVAIYAAHLLGMEIGTGAMIAGIAVATLASIGAVSLPGQISFFTSIAPIALAMGVPIGPLALLIAVETIPDMFRTVGNVTVDVAVAAAVDRTESRSESRAEA
jgi:Na+/H+-dicarboxylate symporter